MVTSIQAHPCNPATAAAAGFKVINLPLEENGYPSLDALKAAVGRPRTALMMINNPDDMGIYNPEIKEWVRLAKEAGALCFYDHANFNGVMGKLRRANSASTPACSCCTRPSARRRRAAARPSAPMAARRSWRPTCPRRSS
jgi:glycine cleavage system protein P-like pyridoxal-binding family